MARLMLVVDTNVLVAWSDENHPHHAEAKAIIRQHTPLAASVLTLAEFLVYPAKEGKAEQLLTALDNIGVEVFPIGIHDSITLAQLRAETGLKMPDVVVLALAKRLRARLATFDRQLRAKATDAKIKILPHSV
jgi:predicted nucleic acid-binding protein